MARRSRKPRRSSPRKSAGKSNRTVKVKRHVRGPRASSKPGRKARGKAQLVKSYKRRKPENSERVTARRAARMSKMNRSAARDSRGHNRAARSRRRRR